MQTLEKTIKIDLSDFHLKRVRRIDAENFTPIKKKYMHDCLAVGQPVSEEYADCGILALKQYYAVALLDPHNSHAVSDIVDPLWHAHLLFSEQYHSFSVDVVGVYMHHIPLDHDHQKCVENVEILYSYTREAMDILFTSVNDQFVLGLCRMIV